jgi:hypothetical protein
MDEVLAREMTRKPDPIEGDETTAQARTRRGPIETTQAEKE